ncbi:MFS transporter [Trueperella pyogenes]|uniref:MFS transporter n=1 Tax=Trueperella pyogenes TaxID=1661 RepID=UPI003132F3EA
MPDPHSDKPAQSPIDPGSQANLVVGIVFLAYMGQMILNPIIAPLSRQMGLQEWHIGATISLAAIVLASLSAYWGRASQRQGAKRVLTTGLTVAIIALSAFGVVYLGMNQGLSGIGLVFGVVITRGLLYGAGISAIAPTAQAHLVTHTSENGRVKALGMIGAPKACPPSSAA